MRCAIEEKLEIYSPRNVAPEDERRFLDKPNWDHEKKGHETGVEQEIHFIESLVDRLIILLVEQNLFTEDVLGNKDESRA